MKVSPAPRRLPGGVDHHPVCLPHHTDQTPFGQYQTAPHAGSLRNMLHSFIGLLSQSIISFCQPTTPIHPIRRQRRVYVSCE